MAIESWGESEHSESFLLGWDKLFNSILSNPSHKLYSLLPPKNECEVNLRSQHSFTTRRLHTIRTRNSFIHHYVHKAMM